MLSSKDINFVGYTYKNFEIVNDYQVPGIGELSLLYMRTFLSVLQGLIMVSFFICTCVGQNNISKDSEIPVCAWSRGHIIQK